MLNMPVDFMNYGDNYICSQARIVTHIIHKGPQAQQQVFIFLAGANAPFSNIIVRKENRTVSVLKKPDISECY